MKGTARLFLLATIVASGFSRTGLTIAQMTVPVAGAVAANIPYLDAKPILEALREDLLPAELQARTPGQIEAAWPQWVTEHDAQIRARLESGDHDSVINFLLFGVTFTKHPRMTARDILLAAREGRTAEVLQTPTIQARIGDLIAGAASPGADERLQFVRGVIEARGFDPATTAGRDELRRYLDEGLRRVLAELEPYSRAPASEQSVRFGDRGLSSDTSISPSFAIDQALEALRTERLFAAGSVRRVAIVGPGLDFTDKREGYDFYPQQTLQPFAVIDSLRRLRLADSGVLRATTFDLSPRVNQHLELARARARAGEAYVLHLPRDPASAWTRELVAYWKRFGETLGEPATPTAVPPEVASIEVRAVRVPPGVVLTITPVDLNIVLQRLDPMPASDQFDLVVATNLLVYYDAFERSLALANVAKMLRPGGILLANNATPVVLPSTVESIGFSDIAYSSRVNDRDRIVWYRRR